MSRLTKNQEKRLQSIYYNKEGGEGAYTNNFRAIRNVYNEKYAPEKISQLLVKKYISDQYVYQRHKARKKKFPRNVVYSPAPGAWFGIDLGDFTTFSEFNNGYKYFLIGCDIFTKVVYGEAIKNKSKNTVLEAFKKILKRVKHRPLIVCSDLGSEFISNVFQNFLKKEKIGFVSLQGQFHNSVTERALKTIKDKMGRLWTNLGTPNWSKYLQEIIATYNNTTHSSIKMKPIEVEEWNSDIVYRNLYPKKINRINGNFKKGDLVRISLTLGQFSKGYEGYFSKQIFEIIKGPFYTFKGKYPLYKIADSYNKNVIPGSWYENEIQKINKKLFKHKKNTEYDIKVIETSGNMSKIHYLGWPSTYNEWIKTSKIINHKII